MSQEFKAMLWTVVKRFLRAFAAGSVASVLAILASAQLNPVVLQDKETFIYSLLLGGMVGGLQAIDKLVRYTPEQQ